MNPLLQDFVVAVVVVACAAFSAWRLMSLTLRLRLLATLARVPLLADARWLARLRAAAACGR